jgi:hypothetical protein
MGIKQEHARREQAIPAADAATEAGGGRGGDGGEGVGGDDGFRWTAKLWLATLLGGWLALALLAGFLHWMLGDFRAIDLGALLLGGIWGLVLVFAGIAEPRSDG